MTYGLIGAGRHCHVSSYDIWRCVVWLCLEDCTGLQ